MKKIILSGLIGFLLGGLVMWQAAKFMPRRWNPEAHHKHIVKLFSKRLNLSQDQQTKVSAILDETRKKIEGLREATKPKFEEIRQETRQKIKSLLNPDQQKKYDVLDEEMDARRRKERRP